MGALLLVGAGSAGCGAKIPFEAGDATKIDAIGTSGSIGAIAQVTMVVQAQDLGSTWPASDWLFTGTDFGLGNNAVADDEVGIRFVYSYPPNNFKLSRAQLLIDVARDATDTEAIMIGETGGTNGVLTGRAPAAQLMGTTTRLAHDYNLNGAAPAGQRNGFFNQWQVDHYKTSPSAMLKYRNTSDFNLLNLLSRGALGTGTVIVPVLDMVDSGDLSVLMGDDTTVYQGYLILTGYTIAKESLSCANSSSKTFENVYVHQDGNSVSGATFLNGNVYSGTAASETVFDSWSQSAAPDDTPASGDRAYTAPFQSVEFNFDAPLPNVGYNNVTISQAALKLTVERQASGYSAIIINGLGIAQTGFLGDVSTPSATSAVESWTADATIIAKWETFLSTLTPGAVTQDATLDLVNLLGAAKVKELLAQGRLNISIAGAIGKVYAQRRASGRVPGTGANGPELSLQGTYFNKICSVPNDPDSPLSGTLPDYPPAASDTTPPEVTSVQTLEVTDTTAKVLWLTDEWATSTVEYATGVDFSTDTLLSPSTITLPSGAQADKDIVHEVALTGLSKYSIYFFRVRSTDYWGNIEESPILLFRTKR